MDGVHSEEVDLSVAQRKEDVSIRPIAFLFSPYEPVYWWWEVVECLRRFLLTSSQVFLSKTEPSLHLVITLCMSLIILKVR